MRYFAEREIRDAMERGEFEDLEGQGRPLPGRGTPDPPDWWATEFAKRERRRDVLAEERRAIQAELEMVWMITTESTARETLRDLAQRSADHGLAPIDVGRELEDWRRAARLRFRLGR